jgi:hypothetical protein
LHLKYSSSFPVVQDRVIESETISPPGNLDHAFFDFEVTASAAFGYAADATPGITPN